MAKFAEIILTNTNLTGVTNSFSVFLKHCSGSTYTTIQTGLTYSDFPYLVNLDNTFGSINCYDYQVSEDLTGLICGGQQYTGITPSVSVTPTTTPSVTSTPQVSLTSTPTTTPSVTQTPTITPSVTPSNVSETVVSFGVEYSSGSTIATYTFTADTVVNEDLTINFKNIIYKNNGDEIDINSSVTILQNNRIGSNSVTLSSVDYADIRPYEMSYADITSNKSDVIYNKYSKVVYDEKPDPAKYVNYLFKPCCSDGTRPLNLMVTEESLQPTGWVGLGFGVLVNGVCYIASEPGGDGSDGTYYGPDIKSCSEIYGCRPCETVTPTPTKSLQPTPTKSLRPTPTISPTPSICNGLDCDVEVTPNPSITPTQTPITPLSCDVAVTPVPTITPTQTTITNLDCDVMVTPVPTVTPTQTVITNLNCDVDVS